MALFERGPGGEAVSIVSRMRLTERAGRAMVIREMVIMRSRGFTDAEIGLKYRYRRETVNRMINSVPDDVKARLREVKLV